MATEVTRSAPQTLGATDRLRAISLPDWLARLSGRLGEVTLDGHTKTKYLPAGLTLTTDERTIAEQKRDQIAEMLNASSDGVGRRGIVAELLMSYPLAIDKSAGRASGAARGDAYEAALNDVPAWALRAAVTRWHRGEAGSDHNYAFAPAPAILRSACLQILKFPQDTLRDLNDLLNAKPLSDVLAIDRKPDPKVVSGFADLSKSLGAAPDAPRPVNERIAEIAAAARAPKIADQPEPGTDGA
jgi:hypothetical protein